MTTFSYGQSQKKDTRVYFAEDALKPNPEFDMAAVQQHAWLLLSASDHLIRCVSTSTPSENKPFVPTILAIESRGESILGQRPAKVGSVIQGPTLASALRNAVEHNKTPLSLVTEATEEKINYYTIRLGE